MPNTTNSPNLGMPVPVPSTDPGPQWATDINTCLSILDGHTHAPGSGLPIGTNGININADLPFNSFNATTVKTTRYAALGSPATSGTDIGCTYVSGQDLWYNDTLGRQVRITQGGAVIGSSGNITNLIAPAAITYVPGTATFVFSSSASVAANIDVATIKIRNATSGSNAVTLQASAATPTLTFTLPNSVPSTGKALTSDPSGNLGYTLPTLSYKQSSFSSSGWTSNTTTYTNVLSNAGTGVATSAIFVTITTNGNRPVLCGIVAQATSLPASSADGSYIYVPAAGTAFVGIFRNEKVVASQQIVNPNAGAQGYPVGFFSIDYPGASSSYTYTLQGKTSANGLQVHNAGLVIYEL